MYPFLVNQIDQHAAAITIANRLRFLFYVPENSCVNIRDVIYYTSPAKVLPKNDPQPSRYRTFKHDV